VKPPDAASCSGCVKHFRDPLALKKTGLTERSPASRSRFKASATSATTREDPPRRRRLQDRRVGEYNGGGGQSEGPRYPRSSARCFQSEAHDEGLPGVRRKRSKTAWTSCRFR
jgi:hypothetical protein